MCFFPFLFVQMGVTTSRGRGPPGRGWAHGPLAVGAVCLARGAVVLADAATMAGGTAREDFVVSSLVPGRK